MHFHNPSPAIIEPHPSYSLSLKADHENIAWWNTPAGYALGKNIRDYNVYHTKNYPFVLGLMFLFGFFCLLFF